LTSANEIDYRDRMPSTTYTDSPSAGVREAQRLATRARVFEAALSEIGRSGLAGADVAAIAAAAGVVRGTFYFHFPSKEHVLAELERAEEAKIVARLDTKATKPGELIAMLRLLVREVLAAERRLGPVVFRDMLGLHFSATRPVEDELTEHPLAQYLINVFASAQAAGQVRRDADPGELGVIFLTGLFALLATGLGPSRARTALLDRYVTTIVQGMEAP
jgi:AcrR family transcriptional regulator